MAVTKTLLVGCGRMGLGHLEAIRQLPDLAEVVAGVDPVEAARQRLTADFGLHRTYRDLEEALRQEQTEAVFICSPNHLHARYALAALRAGRHVFVEKPMALAVADADDMVRTAEQLGRLLMSGQTLRFSPPIRHVKALVDAGRVGRVRHVVHRRMGSSRGGDEHSWFARQAESGGILPGIGSHSLDAILWWLGEPASTVYAVVQSLDPHPAVDIEDEVSLVATTPSGAMIDVALSFHHQAGTEWIVAGTEGVIRVSGSRDVFLNDQKQEGAEQVVLPGEGAIQREFFCAIREGRPLAQASGRQVRDSVALICAAQESGRTGQPVRVS